MPFRRRVATRRSARSPRRKTQWAETNAGHLVSTTAVHSNCMADLETAWGSNVMNCTILRMVGWVSLTRAAATDASLSDWGFIVDTDLSDVDDHAPTASPYIDWMAKGRLNLQPTTLVVGEDQAFQRFDLRARRRLPDVNTTLWFVSQNPGAPVGSPLLRMHVRVLIALP